MKKITIFLLIILLISPLSSYAKSSVWVAEKEGHKIILAASVHLLHPSQLPLPNEYFQAFNESKRVAFEIDLAELNSLAAAAQMAQQFQLQGTTLDKTLKPEVWNKLAAVMQKYNIPTQFTLFDAAFMSFSLPMVIWQQQGYHAGIDKILYDKAIAEGKEVQGLETLSQQLAALATLKQLDPNVLIEQTLTELADPRFSLATMIQQIYSGDTKTIQQQIEEYTADPTMEKFYQNLLVNRNKAWINKIEQWAASDKPTLVVVGAMHLIGEDCVLKLLAADGYNIAYYQTHSND